MGRVSRVLGACSASAVLLGTVSVSGVSSAAIAAAKKPITVGLLTDVTGPASSTFASTESGVLARFKLQNSKGGVKGHPLKLIVGDTGTSPVGALTAAQSLDSQGALGILGVSAVTSGASRYMTQAGIPVTGPNFDASEWDAPTNYSQENMFPIEGYYKPGFPSVTTVGLFLKQEGVRDIGTVAPQTGTTATSAQAVLVSARVAGIPSTYANLNMPPTTLDFSTIALAIKQSGVDAIYAPLGVSQSIALMTALSQAGVHLKVFLASTGYGQNTLGNAALAPLAALGNVFFLNRTAPLEMNTAATKVFARAARNEGIVGIPEFGATEGWMAADLFIAGLEGGGPNPTRSSLFFGLRHLTNFTEDGLYGTIGVNYTKRNLTKVAHTMGPDNCAWFVQLLPGKFVPVKKASPLCGKFIPGSSIQ
jgi:branched-chain amino acid transport system substrate-binding protein